MNRLGTSFPIAGVHHLFPAPATGRGLAVREEAAAYRAIAKDIGMCTRSVTLLLRERFTKEGKTTPDGRTRRWTKQVHE